MEQALRTAASCDELTGLPNRRALLDRAQDAIDLRAGIRRRRRHGVHRPRPVQARQRRARSRRRRRAARARRRAHRGRDPRSATSSPASGSDEFVVLCPSADDLDAIKAVALRIVDALGGAFIVAGNEVFIGASIGVSVSTGEETPLELLRFADTAMYRAKARGNPGVEVFDRAMENNAARRLGLESALRQATRRGELVTLLPADRRPRRRRGSPTSKRWCAGTGPASGCIAARQLHPRRRGDRHHHRDRRVGVAPRRRRLPALAGRSRPDVGVSVNVSVRQFESGDLVGDGARRAARERASPRISSRSRSPSR